VEEFFFCLIEDVRLTDEHEAEQLATDSSVSDDETAITKLRNHKEWRLLGCYAA
jgi:hypothetical protein